MKVEILLRAIANMSMCTFLSPCNEICAPASVAFCTSTAWNLLPVPKIADAMKVQTVAAINDM